MTNCRQVYSLRSDLVDRDRNARRSRRRTRAADAEYRPDPEDPCSHDRLCRNASVDAGKCVHRAMLVPFGFIQALSTGKHEINAAEQFLFQRRQIRMGAFERGKLVHAIVNTRDRIEVGKAERHRRVVPKNVLIDRVIEKSLYVISFITAVIAISLRSPSGK